LLDKNYTALNSPKIKRNKGLHVNIFEQIIAYLITTKTSETDTRYKMAEFTNAL
jgi:hypothetical protein